MPRSRTLSRSSRVQSQPRLGVRRTVDWRVGRIISIIASGNYPNCQTLAREIEVSAKTIQRDLDHLRHQKDLPLEYDEVRHGFYFTRPVSEFAPMQLSRGELLALFIALKALEPLRGTPLYRQVAESLNKIAGACPDSVSIQWQDLHAACSLKQAGAIQVDAALFSTLLDATLNRQEVAFSYRKLNGGGRGELRRVRPCHVGNVMNGWYLIGHDLARGDWRTFALQRISGLEVLKNRFVPDASFNIRDHLSSGFGVWSYGAEAESFEACIRLTGWAARYVAEGRWHRSQKITPLKDDGSEIEFRAELAGLEEITRWVLGFGRHAKVLSPKKLRDAVQAEARAILEI